MDVEIEDCDEGLPTSIGGDGTDASPTASEKDDWFIEENKLVGMKDDNLRTEIRRRGVKPKGNKGGLQNMLKEIAEKQMAIIEGGPDKNSEALGGFPVGSK